MIRLLAVRPMQTHVLGVAGLVLVAVAAWPWLSPISMPPRSGAASGAPPALAGVPALPPLAAFSAIGERPLFSPSRRPSATAKALVAAGGAARYRLLGLISVGTTRRALIADGTRRFEIGEGSALDGWTIARIEQDRVVLSSAEGETVLALERARAEPPPTAPR